MSIQYHEQTGIFSLETAHSLYQMKADTTGVLLHLYYGEKTGGDMDYLLRFTDRGFSGNPYELSGNRGYSLDTLPQEYSGNGVGDFRLPSVQTLSENGSRSADLRFTGYTVQKGREPLAGLPFVREAEDTETPGSGGYGNPDNLPAGQRHRPGGTAEVPCVPLPGRDRPLRPADQYRTREADGGKSGFRLRGLSLRGL